MSSVNKSAMIRHSPTGQEGNRSAYGKRGFRPSQSTGSPPGVLRSDPLNQQRATTARRATGRHHAANQIAATQFVNEGADHDRSGGTHWMPQGNHPTVDVQALVINTQYLLGLDHRRGECLVNFEKIDVRRGQLLLLQQLLVASMQPATTS